MRIGLQEAVRVSGLYVKIKVFRRMTVFSVSSYLSHLLLSLMISLWVMRGGCLWWLYIGVSICLSLLLFAICSLVHLYICVLGWANVAAATLALYAASLYGCRLLDCMQMLYDHIPSDGWSCVYICLQRLYACSVCMARQDNTVDDRLHGCLHLHCFHCSWHKNLWNLWNV